MILDCIFESHHERILHESIGSKSKVQIKTVIKVSSTYNKEGLSFLYPTRGERMKKEESESDEIYAELFDNEIEINNRGKIVAIDLDDREIACISRTLLGP